MSKSHTQFLKDNKGKFIKQFGLPKWEREMRRLNFLKEDNPFSYYFCNCGRIYSTNLTHVCPKCEVKRNKTNNRIKHRPGLVTLGDMF